MHIIFLNCKCLLSNHIQQNKSIKNRAHTIGYMKKFSNHNTLFGVKIIETYKLNNFATPTRSLGVVTQISVVTLSSLTYFKDKMYDDNFD